MLRNGVHSKIEKKNEYAFRHKQNSNKQAKMGKYKWLIISLFSFDLLIGSFKHKTYVMHLKY